jgi:ADP-ribosyl-[dinitrogen reductase] hydrolase
MKMLLSSAIGDAYGAGFEFEAPALIAQHNTLARYRQHPLYTEICGRYTDDTQMALAIAELIVSEDEWTPERIAEGFVAAFRRDPRRGYSSRFYDILMQVRSGKELMQVLHPGSDRNGAAMRAYPIGVYRDAAEVRARAAMQARITHDSPAGVAAAQAVALMSHYNLYRLGEKRFMGDYVTSQIGGDWHRPWEGEVGMQAGQAVRAAITLIANEASLGEMLRKGVALGGDVDTVGAITVACASGNPEVAQDLPAWMAEELENGTYGRDYIVALQERLSLFCGGQMRG